MLVNLRRGELKKLISLLDAELVQLAKEDEGKKTIRFRFLAAQNRRLFEKLSRKLRVMEKSCV